jgi:hypothetical protein
MLVERVWPEEDWQLWNNQSQEAAVDIASAYDGYRPSLGIVRTGGAPQERTFSAHVCRQQRANGRRPSDAAGRSEPDTKLPGRFGRYRDRSGP